MKHWNWKVCLSFVLAFAMCLSLAACGGTDDSGNDTGDDGSGTPEAFEGMVKDSELLVDYGMYYGTWSGEDGSELIVEPNDSGEVRFALYDTGEDVTASGYVQLVQEYSADYFYNEHDGWAHHSWMDEEGALHVDSFGVFVKASPEEESGESDSTALAGVWFLDGEADAFSIIEIDETGNWALMERPGGDGDPTAVDSGIIEQNPDGDGRYDAVSTMFDDVVYDMTIVSDDGMYWGGENDYYERMA